jgi:hypothetical protein
MGGVSTAGWSSAVYDAANRLRQWGAAALLTTTTQPDRGWNEHVHVDARDRLASMTGRASSTTRSGGGRGRRLGSDNSFNDGVNPVQEIGTSTVILRPGWGG